MKYYKIIRLNENSDLNGKVGEFIKIDRFDQMILLKFNFDHCAFHNDNGEYTENRYGWFYPEEVEKFKIEYNKVSDNIKQLFNLRELL